MTKLIKNEHELLRQVVWPSHEPLAFLRRRVGPARGYGADYKRYHKGLGLRQEAVEMRRCCALAREMHRQGLGVCVDLGGTMHTETMYRDHAEARDWACEAGDDGPVAYMMHHCWRHLAAGSRTETHYALD